MRDSFGYPVQQFREEVFPDLDEEPSPEEKEWQETWLSMTREALDIKPGSICLVDEDLRNRSIRLELEGPEGTNSSEIVDSIIGGVRLTEPAAFKSSLDFYTSSYAAIVNALCGVEGVQRPNPRILLGSGLLK